MCEKIEKRKKERKRTRIDSVCCHACHGWRVVRIKYPLSSRFFPRPRRWSIETRRWARRRAARQTTVIALANQCKWNLSFSIVLHFIYLYLPLLSLFTFSSFFTPSFYLFLFTLPACMPFFAFFSFSCWTVDARRVHKRNILSEVPYTYTERQRKINEGWFH